LKKLIQQNNKELSIIFLFGFISAVVIVLLLAEREDPEFYEHGLIAENIYENGVYGFNKDYSSRIEERSEGFRKPTNVPGAYIPPLNPLIIYLNYAVFGKNSLAYTAYFLINAILYALALCLVYLIALSNLNGRSATFAVIIYFLYLPTLYSVTKGSGGPLYHFLTLLSIFFAIQIIQKPGLAKYFIICNFSHH
jgi:hypothetical protein